MVIDMQPKLNIKSTQVLSRLKDGTELMTPGHLLKIMITGIKKQLS